MSARSIASIKTTVLYDTYSVCPRCTLLELKGLEWKDAQVVLKNNQVFLSITCRFHGTIESLYCSNADFFKKLMKYGGPQQQQAGSDSDSDSDDDVPDIEDLRKMLNYTAKNSSHPLIAELVLYQNGSFISDDEIKNEIQKFKSIYPPNTRFVIKVSGKVATDMNLLNSKIEFVESLTSPLPILLELSFERLIAISRLTNSVILHPRVYPALKFLQRYYLQKGEEETCKNDLESAMQAIREYKGVPLFLSFVLERPYPDISKILELIRKEKGYIRFVVFSLERSPSALVKSLEAKYDIKERQAIDVAMAKQKLTAEPSESANADGYIDAYEFLQHIEQSSGGTVKVNDFYPSSMATVLEPLLATMNYGNFSLKSSPFCGLVSCLLNTDHYVSTPFNRVFNFEKFYAEMMPMLPKLKGASTLGSFFLAGQIKKILQSCTQPGLPDLFSYLTDSNKSAITSQFIKNLQFIVVHNNMDLGSIDIVRRCKCASVTSSKATPNGIAAQCSGCI